MVGPEPAVASGARVLGPDDLAAAMPYLQPLALSAATRKRASKALLHELRSEIASHDRAGARRRSSDSCGCGRARCS